MTAAVPGDDYLVRMAKYVPAEVLGFSMLVNAILAQAMVAGGDNASMAGFPVTGIAAGALIAGLVLTPLFCWYVREDGDAWLVNAFVSTVAFPFWSYLMGAVAFAKFHDGNLAVILILTFTAVSGLVAPLPDQSAAARAEERQPKRWTASGRDLEGLRRARLDLSRMAAGKTILMFNSGLGGLTVYREVVAARPDADFVYVADDAAFPYGDLKEPTLVKRVVELFDELIAAHRPDLVVIPCNTASTIVLPDLRKKFTLPIVGTVPAIKPACAASVTRRVSVLGTEATVKREYTRALIRDYAQDCEVTLVGSKQLAAYAEAQFAGAAVGDDGHPRGDHALLSQRRQTHRHGRPRLYPLSAADRPAAATGAVAGEFSRSGARDRAAGGRASRSGAGRHWVGTTAPYSRRDARRRRFWRASASRWPNRRRRFRADNCLINRHWVRRISAWLVLFHWPHDCTLSTIDAGKRSRDTDMSTAVTTTQPSVWYLNRWNQLILGVIAMMAISSPQYVWTLFTGPLNQKLGTTLAELQWTFSLLIILQTWFSPFQAYLVDRFGPRLLISIGALLSGGSWVLSSSVENLWALYLTYGVIGGFGTGIIYVGIIGLMVRWFPDRRGLATGLAAAGYGFGAFFTSFPIDSMIKSSGYAHTLLVWGIIQGVSRHPRGAMAAHPSRELRGVGRGADRRNRLAAGPAQLLADARC